MTRSMTGAVDAMGGENAPHAIVAGAVRAVAELGVPVTLVGRREVIDAALTATGGAPSDRLWISDARDVIEMDEHPANAVRAKRDASIVRACALVAEGTAGAAVSAGNSGAMLAAALFTVKRVAGVARPAIGATFPSAAGQTFILDVGANTDCKPDWLAQFAAMGDIYAVTMLGVAEPRGALLRYGEEPEQGPALVPAAHPLIAALSVSVVGHGEGKAVFGGVA